MNNELLPKWQLLSAYLDGQLNERDIRKADELLRQNDSAREAFDMLRRNTRHFAGDAHAQSPPQFHQQAGDGKAAHHPALHGGPSFSSAMAALLLVAVLALDFLGLSAP